MRIAKQDMPLFLAEQEYRFNHRFTGKELMNKAQEYIIISFHQKVIIKTLDAELSFFALHVPDGRSDFAINFFYSSREFNVCSFDNISHI